MRKPIDDAIDKTVLLICSGLPAADMPAAVEKLGVTRRRVAKVIEQAKTRISDAAHVDREAAIGKSIVRFEDLYARSLKSQDLKTALTAQRELVRLLDLKRQPPKAGTGNNEELAAVARWLLPLKLADETWPLREHARLAAETIRRTNGHRNGKGAPAHAGC